MGVLADNNNTCECLYAHTRTRGSVSQYFYSGHIFTSGSCSANLFSQELQGCKRSQVLDMMTTGAMPAGRQHQTLAVKGLGTQEQEVVAQVK